MLFFFIAVTAHFCALLAAELLQLSMEANLAFLLLAVLALSFFAARFPGLRVWTLLAVPVCILTICALILFLAAPRFPEIDFFIRLRITLWPALVMQLLGSLLAIITVRLKASAGAPELRPIKSENELEGILLPAPNSTPFKTKWMFRSGYGAAFFRQNQAICACLAWRKEQNAIIFEPGFCTEFPGFPETAGERLWLQRQTLLEMLRLLSGIAEPALIIAWSASFINLLKAEGLSNITPLRSQNQLTALQDAIKKEFGNWDFLEHAVCFSPDYA